MCQHSLLHVSLRNEPFGAAACRAHWSVPTLFPCPIPWQEKENCRVIAFIGDCLQRQHAKVRGRQPRRHRLVEQLVVWPRFSWIHPSISLDDLELALDVFCNNTLASLVLIIYVAITIIISTISPDVPASPASDSSRRCSCLALIVFSHEDLVH